MQKLASSARPVAVHSNRPRAFTSARSVTVRAAPKESQMSVSQLLEGAKFEAELEDILDDMSAQNAMDDDDDEDDGVQAAFEAGLLMTSTESEELQLAMVGQIKTTPEELQTLQRSTVSRVSSALSRGAAGGQITDSEANLLISAAGDAASLPDHAYLVEEAQHGPGVGRSDDEEFAGISKDQKEAISKLKLSKADMKNLVPKDWDTINIDWFTNSKEENIPLPEFKLNVLWMSQNVAISVDTVYSRGQTSPLTEYFFWPRNDAWDEMKGSLESRPWIAERDKVVLLNRLTQLINYWQEQEVKHTIEEARNVFPDCTFATV
ncbi:MAG: hypothetical protein WDW38_006981 [Sanguina aurantia]